MRQGNDLEVVTAPKDAADDEIGQNCKEKKDECLAERLIVNEMPQNVASLKQKRLLFASLMRILGSKE
ncbi:MAG: hypothetical protein WC966_11275 [Bradymonadales bacterium]|jgi:hypothetical protein